MTRSVLPHPTAALRAIAATRPGAWLYARTLPHLDRLLFRLTGRRLTLTSLVTGLPVAVVTTTGARSGRPRVVPLLYVRDDDHPERLALIASNWGQARLPAWYFNLKANPRADCSIDGHAGAYTAHEAGADEYARIWRRAVEIYPGYARYRERVRGRPIPILILSPASPPAEV